MGGNILRVLRRLIAIGCGITALFAGSAFAQTQTIFGPIPVTLPNSNLFSYSSSFNAPGSVTGPYLLRVKLSAPNSLTTLSFKLNNVQVLSLADFAGGKTQVDKTVTVQTHNTFSLQIAGKKGTVITVTVFGTPNLPKPTSLAPNPLSITVGAGGTLTATLSPTPASAGTLSVASANTAVATVPAIVGFASGQTSVAISVTAVGVGNAIITASANGGQASATVNVTPAPPTITSLAPGSLTLTQGASANLTVTISAAQTSDTQVLVSSNHASIASVPASVTVAAGQVSASIPVSALAVGAAQITATLNGSTASSNITVNPAPPTVVSLLPATATVALGAGTSLTLTISAAQATDTVVQIAASPAGIVTAPASATVPAGQTTAPVSVGTVAYGQAGVTASLNGTSASSVVNVVPPPLQVLSIVPATFTMNVGATSQFTVNINAAQLAGTSIALAVDNPLALQVPASVTIAQGQTSAIFTATGLSTGNAIITASANNTQKTASVHVAPQAAAIVSLLPDPLPLQQGASGSLTVTINVAQEADTVIALASDAPAIAQVPVSITVAAGTISAAIPVGAVAPGSANITASVNGLSSTTSVTVTPPPPVVAAITPATVTTPKGTPVTLRVTVSHAPNAPAAISLTSSNPAVASVPATVNIAAGALFADFPVASNDVGQATITATLNGGSATAAVTVAPAELVTLTLSPDTPATYVGDAAQFTAAGTMTDGTGQDFTARATWSSSDATIATIDTAGKATPLAAGTTTIAASYTFTAAATGTSVTIAQSTVLTAKQPVALVLTAPTNTLNSGDSATVTVASSDPAPAGGLAVTLAATGPGSATFPAAVSIAEGGTSASFTLTAVNGGALTLTATAVDRLPGSIVFTVRQLAITSFTPDTGPVGIAVAINGIGFDAVTSNNQVKFNGEPAVIASGTATLLNAIVPPRATTGPITVTNALGTAASATPFTVQDREAFDLVLAPASIQAPLGGNGATRISITSTGLNPYPYAAQVSVSGLPAGITVALDRPSVFLLGNVVATFTTQASVAPGTYPVTISATGQSGVTSITRTQTLQLKVLNAGSTTVSGRVLYADDGSPFVGARLRLGATQVFTDETGTYRFVSPPVLGDQVILIDGNTQNSPTAEYPSGIAMPVFIVAGQDNKVLTSYIQAVDPTSFTNIVPGAAASVTNPNIPNFSLNIPQGATLIGWDGTPVTKVNVRTVSVDRLPIKPIPDGLSPKSVYLYYFFREGGANPTQPIPVTMANDADALPGEKVDMYYYDESATPDPNSNQWRVMGSGTVTPDGKSVVSDPGVGIPKFCCGASFWIRRLLGAFTGAFGGDGRGPSASGPIRGLGGGPGGSGGPRGGGPGPGGGGPRPGGGGGPGSGGPGPGGPGPSGPGPGGPGSSSPGPGGPNPNPANPAQPQTRCPVDLASGNALVFVPRSFGLSVLMPVDFNCSYRSTDPRVGMFGVGMSFTYDWFAEVVGTDAVQVTNPYGVKYMLSREADGVFRAHNGRSMAIEMEVTPTSTGRTLKLADKTQYEFDFGGRLTAAVDANGNRTTFQLNALGFPQSATDAVGAVYLFDVEGKPELVRRITDPQGRFISFTYDAGNHLSSYTDQGGGVTSFEYDTIGRIVKKTDPRGGVETFQYDSLNRVTQETLPDGSTEKFAYNAVASTIMETRHTDGNGNATTYRWNGFGYLVQTTDAMGRTTKYDRDPITNLVRKKTDPAGRVWQYTYNARGDVIQIVDPQNNSTLIDYDLRFSKPVRIQNAIGNVVTMTYDDNANLLSSTNAELQASTFTYTPKGQLASATDALNHTTLYAYDSNGNLLAVTNPAGETSMRVYDVANRMTRAIDPLSRTSTFNYDGLDRVMQVENAASSLIHFSFDANDNVLSVTDPNSNLVERNVYDLRNRLVQRTDAKNLSITYGYDGVGNIVSITDRAGRLTQYSYDTLNRISQVRDADGRTTTYDYDLAGNVARISDSLTGDILISYDSMDRLIEIVTPQGTVSYTYDGIGRRTIRTLSGGDITTYAYDKADRVTSITLRGRTVGYVFDAAGKLVSKTLPNGITAAYQYDAANRLTSIAYARDDGTPIETVAYVYDMAGQRIQKVVGSSAVQETEFAAAYDQANRLISISLNGETFSLAYDENGNLISKVGSTSGTTNYTWDAQNQLVELSGPFGTASFRYDALGRRVERRVNNDTVSYLYDGAQAIAELQGSAIQSVYHTGVDIDEVLARYSSSENRTLLTDALRSVIAQTADDQSVQNFYTYTPYGEVTTLGPDDTNLLQFTGRENDGTGLYFHRSRYYDPVLKRFISEDPIGISSGLNTYLYTRGNPVLQTDPSGLMVVSVGVGGSFQAGDGGASQSYSVGASTSGQLCVMTTTCARLGAGASAGAGFTGSVGTGSFCEGNTGTLGVFGEGGDGVLGGGSVDVGSDGVSGSINFKGFLGGGAAAGAQLCITRTKCW